MSELPPFLTRAELRLLFFTGKGGVGKTTCAAAAAVALSRHADLPLLLVSTDPAHSLRDSLGEGPSPPGLTVVEFRAEDALAAFLDEHRAHFREIARRGTFLADEDVDRFTELSLPGMDEFLAVLQLSRWVAESKYERIVVDTAPTGHTLRLLETPRLMARWLAAMEALVAKHRYMRSLFTGRYRRDEVDSFLDDWSDSAARLAALLEDPRACLFVPVTTAERLSVEETTRLLGELESCRLPVSDVVVNRLTGAPVEGCRLCSEDGASELRELRQLPAAFERYVLWAVPRYGAEVQGREGLAGFWSAARPLSLARLRAAELPVARAPLLPRAEGRVALPARETVLVAVAGKGGVGKTTLASAIALRLARAYPGRSLLLCSSDPAHSLSDCLDLRVGPAPAHVRPNLAALEIDAAAALETLKAEYAEELERALSTLLPTVELPFDRPALEKLLDLSPPGIDEVMALAEVSDILDGGEYDLVVLDTAPTGHFLRLLETPAVVEEWLRAFRDVLLKYGSWSGRTRLIRRVSRLARNVRRFRNLLVDPGRAAVYAVSILTEMAFEETRDLLRCCTGMGVAVPVLFLNLATPPSTCGVCAARRASESEVRERFARAFPGRHQVLVHRGGAPRGLAALEVLGDELFVG